jgi:hypothetical protein
MRIANEQNRKDYCKDRGIKWPKEAKSPFQPLVM